jgi:hypothetical protein
MHAMMHLVWFAIPLFSADRTRAVPIGSLVPILLQKSVALSCEA